MSSSRVQPSVLLPGSRSGGPCSRRSSPCRAGRAPPRNAARWPPAARRRWQALGHPPGHPADEQEHGGAGEVAHGVDRSRATAVCAQIANSTDRRKRPRPARPCGRTPPRRITIGTTYRKPTPVPAAFGEHAQGEYRGEEGVAIMATCARGGLRRASTWDSYRRGERRRESWSRALAQPPTRSSSAPGPTAWRRRSRWPAAADARCWCSRRAADARGRHALGASSRCPGFLHDVCSAVHPLAAASPFFRTLPLADHGLELGPPGRRRSRTRSTTARPWCSSRSVDRHGRSARGRRPRPTASSWAARCATADGCCRRPARAVAPAAAPAGRSRASG